MVVERRAHNLMQVVVHKSGFTTNVAAHAGFVRSSNAGGLREERSV